MVKTNLDPSACRTNMGQSEMVYVLFYREVLKILLRQPVLSVSDNLLSLEEILKEGSPGSAKDRRQRLGSKENLTDQQSRAKVIIQII